MNNYFANETVREISSYFFLFMKIREMYYMIRLIEKKKKNMIFYKN